jgi:predicted component of type VI protein secretion system
VRRRIARPFVTEFLLNTRRTIVEVPEWAQELAYSLHNYGVPDFSSFSILKY